MARTISTALNGQLLLSESDSPLTIASTGSVAVTTSDAISGGSGTAWQVLNSGSISATASSAAGIYFAGSGWSVQNSGKIQGASAGVYASEGGTVTNNVGGLISGASNYGVYISGGPGVVSNAGTITGGWLAVNFAFNSASNRLVAAPGAVFNGLVRGGAGTLELAAPVAGGPSTGSIGGLSTTTSGTFQNFQTLTVDTGAAWTLTGANTITNIIDNGSLVVTGSLPAANIQIGGGAALEVASAPATPSPIVFAAGALKSTLKIDNYATFGTNVGGSSYSGPLLENFGAGDTIDIANLSAAGATLSYNSATGLLQITNGAKVASLSFQNSSLSGAFALSSDGGTGVYLTTGSMTEALVADTGSSSTDGVTNNAALTGTAAANAAVTLSEGATTLGAATANASGVWTFTPTTLSQGVHTILASTASGSASLTFTYDTVAPAVTEAFVNGALTGTGDPNAQVTLSEGGVAFAATTANASGAWTYTPTSLSVGPHTVIATETDSAGNSGSATVVFTPTPVTLALVADTGSSSTDGVTNNAALTGTAAANAAVTLSEGATTLGTATANPSGVWTFTPTTLSQGVHTILASTASGSASLTFTYDATTPIPVFVSTPPSTGATTTAFFTFGTSNNDTAVVYGYELDGASSWTAVAGGSLTLQALPIGAHTLLVRATDAAGNISATPVSYTWSIGVAGRIISTALTTKVALSGSDNPLTIASTGSVTVTTSDAISGGSGTAWQILNSGSISATASSAAGIYFAGSGWSVQNSGKIQGGSAGVYASGGGTVTNNVGGLISGASNYGVYISGGPGVVSNAGTITGGWLAVNFAFNSASNRLVAAPGAVFNGLVRGGAGTLELAAPVAGGPSTGSIGGLSTTTSGTFQNFQTLTVDTGAAWTLTGANTITNIIDNGSLVVTGSLPAANIQIGGGAALEVASAPATPSPIVFAAGALKSTLKIDNYATFGTNVGGSSYSGPLLENFGAGDTIDIANLSAAGATLSYNSATGLLQITNGAKVASLSFQNSSLSGAFALSSDGGTGVYLTTGSMTEALVADTGSSSTDGVTNNAALTGTAAANAAVTLSEGATTLGAATANASGVWTFTPTTLSQGVHTILASTASGSASLTFTYDTVAPAVTEAFVNGALTGTGDPNAQVTLSEGGVAFAATTANASGAWTYTPTSLSVGPHTVIATEHDVAGNSGSASLPFNITTPAVPRYSHIVVVVEENKNYDEIIGNTSQAPYLNSLASTGALLTNFTATLHPSQPNYFDLYAGSTFGITDDGSYQEPGPTVYNTLTSAGLTFRGYVDEPGGSDFNHDPWVSFPEGYSVQTDFSSFPALFPGGDYSSLPTVSFVIPGVDNDMHNGTVQQGDSWLQTNLSSYAQWAKANNSLLVVVWDESDDESATVTAGPNNIVPAILYGANIIPGQYNAAYGFENLLSTITHSYGLTAPNNAASASPITGMFANTHTG